VRLTPTFRPGSSGVGPIVKAPLELDSQTGETVREAFRMRAEGATIAAARDYLTAHRIARSFHGVQAMLRNRLYIGELRLAIS
jgi:Recombinase